MIWDTSQSGQSSCRNMNLCEGHWQWRLLALFGRGIDAGRFLTALNSTIAVVFLRPRRPGSSQKHTGPVESILRHEQR